MEKATPRVRIEEARHKLGELERLTGQSARRFDEIAQRFELFAARGFGVEALNELSLDHLEAFVFAKSDGREPSTSTMHLRRSTLRLLFRIAFEQFGLGIDPTQHLHLPARSTLTSRPLTDDEVAIGRSYSLTTPTATRQPAAWALSEATATTSELPHIVVSNLDLANNRVWLHGSRKRNARWGYLSGWGSTQLERRAGVLKNTTHLIYQGMGTEEVQQISCCIAIKDTLIRAGLGAEPDVRPGSLPAWAGRVVFREVGDIVATAERLGVRSLDAAARITGLSWQG